MARRGLFAVTFLAVACIASTGVLAHFRFDDSPPPSPSRDPSLVPVTVNVQGTVLAYISHSDPNGQMDENGVVQTLLQQAPPESSPALAHFLTDGPDNGTPSTLMRVDFGKRADSISTGDVVQTGLTLWLSAEKAANLDLFGLGNGRRLLAEGEDAEAHEAARNMVSEFHGTRRSLQEVNSLVNLLRSLNVLYLDQVPTSEDPIVLRKTSDKDMFVMNGQQQHITSITFVFSSSSCGVKPNLNSGMVKSSWFDRADSLQRLHNVCSYDQLTFKPENNLIIDVDIPCVGTTENGVYNLKNQVGASELQALGLLAKAHVKKNYPELFSKWTSYRRKILVYPFNWFKTGNALWSGLSNLGCATGIDCFSWINTGGSGRTDLTGSILPAVVFHELGHNIGLMHSASAYGPCDPIKGCSNIEQYGDKADPMGGASSFMCMNAAQAYKAGWASPIAGGHLSAIADFPPGVTREFNLPAMANNKRNMIRIITDINNTVVDDSTVKAQRALFLAYRVAQRSAGGYDSGFSPLIDRLVWIHEYTDTANGRTATAPTILLDAVAAPSNNNAFVPNIGVSDSESTRELPKPFGNLRMRVSAADTQAATVSVCRFLVANESAAGRAACQDGLDNDCDGLVDMADPDCNPALKPPPPASPSPAGRLSPNLRTATKRPPPSPPRSPRNPRPPRGPRTPRTN